MGVRAVLVAVAILGALPGPVRINAETIRAMRSPLGEAPCADGLARAIRWIGPRDLSVEEAEAEARKVPGLDVEWGLKALGDGYGYGSGDGSGDGYGYGSGYGSGDGRGAS